MKSVDLGTMLKYLLIFKVGVDTGTVQHANKLSAEVNKSILSCSFTRNDAD